MVSIETKQKIRKYLKEVGGSNLTELWLATKVCKTMNTLGKWVEKLEKEGMLELNEKEHGEHYLITLK